VVALLAAAVLVPTAAAGSDAPLTTRLALALAVPGNSPAASGVVAVELTNGKPLFERNPDASLEPASNEKLPVTYAALVTLGVSYRFHTDVLGVGSLDGSTWEGDVYLKGFGDPTLTSAKLVQLVGQLKRLGIRQIEGKIVGDDSWFDAMRTAPGWKPSFYLLESPPLSALSVDHGVYQNHIALRPALAAAGRFRFLLRRAGIPSGPAVQGRTPVEATELATVRSAPLPAVLQEMDQQSDNFTAELVLKELGAEAGGAGTTAAGAAVVVRDLAAAGIPLAGVRIVDGSGLSLEDRLTARALATLLDAAWSDLTIRRSFWRALAVAGENGTLEDRMESKPAFGVVHAKTGTTDESSALSGYVGDRYAFSVVQNGEPVNDFAAREAQDRFATTLASTLR
jgi:serine-type D-Ala-D-Ala carboxypeptidase/endopeptidase (penicillin-binding protein 4)